MNTEQLEAHTEFNATDKISTGKRKLEIHDIKLNMSVYTKNIGLNSTLMITIHKNIKVVYQELQSGIISLEEINYQNEAGWTVFMYLAANSSTYARTMIIPKLLALGANVNLKNNKDSTALMYACRYSGKTSSEPIVRLLLDNPNIDVNIIDNETMTALLYACTYLDTSTYNTIKMLLVHSNIDVNIQDKDGRNALMILCKIKMSKDSINDVKEIKEIIELLLNNVHLNINHTDCEGNTALHYLFQNYDKECIEVLAELFYVHPRIRYKIIIDQDFISSMDQDDRKKLFESIRYNDRLLKFD